MVQSDLEAQQKATLLERRGRKQLIALIAVSVFAVGFFASTITVGIYFARHVAKSNIDAAMPRGAAVTITPPVAPASGKGTTIDPAPLVEARDDSPFVYLNGTAGAHGGDGTGEQTEQCTPGEVHGGQALDDMNHGYMALMQKALSVSPASEAGKIRDYYHAALQSVFRCGESMEFGQLEVVEACKGGYVGEGEETKCDDKGSFSAKEGGAAGAEDGA